MVVRQTTYEIVWVDVVELFTKDRMEVQETVVAVSMVQPHLPAEMDLQETIPEVRMTEVVLAVAVPGLLEMVQMQPLQQVALVVLAEVEMEVMELFKHMGPDF